VNPTEYSKYTFAVGAWGSLPVPVIPFLTNGASLFIAQTESDVEKLSGAFLRLPRIQIKLLLVLLSKMILKMSFVSLSTAAFTVSQVKNSDEH
jgi:ABC-type siderophore export system fused ATPase/permease subunit